VPPALMHFSCLAYSSTLKMEATCSSKMSVSGLHSVISKKMKLFITTVVRTSHPTNDRVISE
jgi:hypothetical protein